METCKDCVHYIVCKDDCDSGYLDEDENGNYFTDDCNCFINKADFVEVVRCEDCKESYLAKDGKLRCDRLYPSLGWVEPTDFCSYGERKDVSKMKMTTIDDAEEYKRNAVDTLQRNGQYATAKATEKAFNALIVLMEYERMFSKQRRDANGKDKIKG